MMECHRIGTLRCCIWLPNISSLCNWKKGHSLHRSLRGQIKLQTVSSCIVRLQEQLAKFDIEIVYKKGRTNTNSDCLSRIPDQTHNSETQNITKDPDTTINPENTDTETNITMAI